jgi:hypothetical protein
MHATSILEKGQSRMRTRLSMLMFLSPLSGLLGCAEDPLVGDKAAVAGEPAHVPDNIQDEVGDEGTLSQEHPAGLEGRAGGQSINPAASPAKIIDTVARLAYHLKGLRHNAAVQKAYIASSYVYVTQRSRGTCHLSRLRISGNEARYVDQMTVTNSGHCQTLDMYSYKDRNFFYFSAKAADTTVQYWSMQVARLGYEPGATVDYTDLRRFTYLNYANPRGERLGTTHRVDGGGNSTHTFFRVQTSEGSVTWSIYGTPELNRLLDLKEQVRLDGEDAKLACLGSFTQTGSQIIRPNGSFQGADLLGDSRIFTSGGADGQTPKIALISGSGAYRTLVTITNVGNREIEGVQTKNGNVYFTIVADPVNKRDTQKIYFVPDNVF